MRIKSIDESLKISAMEAKVNVDVEYISSEDKDLTQKLKKLAGILVPGGGV